MACAALSLTPVEALSSAIQVLPGRVAVLVKDHEDGPIFIPEIVHARRRLSQRVVTDNPDGFRKRHGRLKPQYGTVVSSGVRLRVGDEILVIPDSACLTIEPSDRDLPEIGDLIPEGYTLQIFGMWDAWDKFIVGTV